MKVFISYCRETAINKKVLRLADKLIIDGIDCILDQYIQNPELGWHKWIDAEIRASKFVLIVCTKKYLNRSRNEDNNGKGVQFESAISYNEIAQNNSKNSKFIPVLFDQGDSQFIPTPLQAFERYFLGDNIGYEKLYRRLTNQPKVKKPPTGRIKKVPTGINLLSTEKLDEVDEHEFVSHDLLVKEAILDIEIKIDENYNNYPKEKQEKLLNAISAFLEINGNINIKQIRRGSVIMKLGLSPSQCEKLHWAIKTGYFMEFNVIDSQIKELDYRFGEAELPNKLNKPKKDIVQEKHFSESTKSNDIKVYTRAESREKQAIEKYLRGIEKVELITPEEEVLLAIKIKQGDQLAVEKLIKPHLRFVVSVAKQFQNQGHTLTELINAGNLGLIKAAQRFDETKGFRFISYAIWWIRQSILQALVEQSHSVRHPLNKVGLTNKIKKAYSMLEQEFHGEPSAEELASMLEINADNISNELAINESLKDELVQALSALTERQKDVIKYFFGVGYEHPISIDEIGERFGLTRERIRQIKDKAIIKLQNKTKSKLLKDYLKDLNK